jgi:hypothetical protein
MEKVSERVIQNKTSAVEYTIVKVPLYEITDLRGSSSKSDQAAVTTTALLPRWGSSVEGNFSSKNQNNWGRCQHLAPG